MTGTEKCALNEDGSLKDASEIVWYNDKDSEVPIASGSVPTGMFFLFNYLFGYYSIILGRGQCVRYMARMAEIIKASRDSDDEIQSKPSRKKEGNCNRC